MSERKKWQLFTLLSLLWGGLLIIRAMTLPETQEVPLTFQTGQIVGQTTPPSIAGRTAHQTFKPEVAQARPARPRRNIFASLDEPARLLNTMEATPPTSLQLVVPQAGPPAWAVRPLPPTMPVMQTPSPSPEQLAAQQEQQRLEQERQRREQDRQQAQQQLAQYRVMGYVSEDGELRAFLGKGQDIFIVHRGDIVGDHVVVKAVDKAAVILRETNQNVEATLSLTSADSKAL